MKIKCKQYFIYHFPRWPVGVKSDRAGQTTWFSSFLIAQSFTCMSAQPAVGAAKHHR